MTEYCNPNTEIIQHAEDSLIFTADENLSTASEAIETYTEPPCSYFKKNNLQLNSLKTRFVKFSKHANPETWKYQLK